MATRLMDAPLTAPANARDWGWAGQVQWGAIAAGAFAGFGATIIMATLGAAIGITAGASMVDEPMTSTEAERTALGFGIGSVIWMALSAVVVGFVGGAVLNRTARYDRPYMPSAFGLLTWAGGIFIALLVASSGMTGAMGALSGAASGIAAGKSDDALRSLTGTPAAERREGVQPDRGAAPARQLTPEEQEKARRAAETASKTAAAAAWLALGSQLVALAATMLAARWQKAREVPVKYGTQPS
jgi:hypothetical protein